MLEYNNIDSPNQGRIMNKRTKKLFEQVQGLGNERIHLDFIFYF